MNVRVESVSDPFTNPGLARLAARIIAFASTMGIVTQAIRTLDRKTWKVVLGSLREAGLLRVAPVLTLSSGEALESELSRLYEAIEDSPLPEVEWKPMQDVLGDAMLVKLLGISRPSVHRYATGERRTPQDVAERLHVLALIVSDLAGSYNDYGIRRWFERPRAQLGGRAPKALLRKGWGPDDECVRRVRALAAALLGAGAA
jgi:uncharacterized protein (DUF2384 family)